MRAAALLLILTAPPVQAEVMPDALLMAARCIGAEDARSAEVPDHIVPDIGAKARHDAAFAQLLAHPASPGEPALQKARTEGAATVDAPSDPFASVETLMLSFEDTDNCLHVLGALGIIGLVYPAAEAGVP